MVNFNQCIIGVNGSGILASSAELTSENSLQPIFSVGYAGAREAYNGPIKSFARFSYNPNFLSEPGFLIVDEIKNAATGSKAINLSIAGISGSFYLEGLSIRAEPNKLLDVSMSFVSFWPISGNVIANTGETNYQNDKDYFSHGWTTFVSSSGSFTDVPTYALNYEVNFNWEPIYVLGNKYPKQVNLQGGTEKVNVTRDSFTHINYSGQLALESLFNSTSGFAVQFKNLAFNWGSSKFGVFSVTMEGARISNTQLGINIGGISLAQTSCIRNF